MAQRVLSNISVLQQSGLQDEPAHVASESKAGSAASKDKQRLQAMQSTVEGWLKALPALDAMARVDAGLTSDASASPLSRCLAREVVKGRDTVAVVRNDLDLVRYTLQNCN